MSHGTARLKEHMRKSFLTREADTKSFREYIRGKRVVFVGPSPVLQGKAKGEFIDSHEVVVRTGGSVPVPKELWRDYGRRTEVWYVNSVFLVDHEAKREAMPDCLRQGLKWTCVRGLLAGERVFGEFSVRTRVYAPKVPGVKKPTIGMCLAKEIIDAEPSSFRIMGVTFFADGLKDSHLPGYLTSNLAIRQENIRTQGGKYHLKIFGHDYHNGDLWMKQMYDDGKVAMDAETLSYLETALERNRYCDGSR